MDPIGQQYEEMPETELLGRILAGDGQAAVCLVAVRCGPGLKYLAKVKYVTLGLEVDCPCKTRG